MAEYRKGDVLISTDKERLDLDSVHKFLTHSYWATGISKEAVATSISHSVCFGMFAISEEREKQVGFARVLTDFVRFAYLMDVFILEAYRGSGLSKWLVETIMAYPDFDGVQRWMLGTRDAHSLYVRFGFKALAHPEQMMERTSHAPREMSLPSEMPPKPD
jgi:GNAT superfamily N-acetyltransferase